MTRFDDLYWLVAVVDAGTLTRAAQQHGLSTAAISKRLKLLEERLSVRLLERNARRLRTTEAGAFYYQHGKRLLDAFTELEERVASTPTQLHGTIRINAPQTFALRHLAPPISDFTRKHPNLSIQLDLDDSLIDINNSDYDLIIRIGKLADSSLIAQKITDIQLYCCASPDYLKKHGTPKTPDELLEHNCLNYIQKNRVRPWPFSKDNKQHTVMIKGSIQSDSGEFLSQIAKRGHGILMAPDFIVEQDIKDGTLVELLKDYEMLKIGVYVLYPTREYLPIKLSTFIKDLKDYFSQSIKQG